MAVSPGGAAVHTAAAASPEGAAALTADRAAALRAQAAAHTAQAAQVRSAADLNTARLQQGQAVRHHVRPVHVRWPATALYVPAVQAVQAASRHPMRPPGLLRWHAHQAVPSAVLTQTPALILQSHAALRPVPRQAASVAGTALSPYVWATTGARITVWHPATAGLSRTTAPTDAGVAAITASAIA